MTIPWGQIGLLASETLLVAVLLLFVFHRRAKIGLAPLYLAVGCLQPLQVLLASSLYLEVWPGMLVSPGSAVLFPATLMAVLLVYIREDAAEARRLIYGVLTANIVVSVLFYFSGMQIARPGAVLFFELPPELLLQNVRVMLVGTFVLFLDALLIIVVFERTSRLLWRVLFAHLFVTFALVLAFDTVAFSVGAFLGERPLSTVVLSGLVGKTLMAIPYSAVLAVFLSRTGTTEGGALGETAEHVVRARRLDPFARFSFRQRYEVAREQALRDPLTGLHNRGFFDEVLPLTLEGSRRSGSRVALLMIDLEGFKQINDTYGHLAGDDALRRFAEMLRASARAEDVVCRFGGDEFAVIIRQGTGDSAAETLVERIETQRQQSLHKAVPLPGTTIGYASFPEDGESARDLLEVADKRLYAQRRGEPT